MWMVVQRGVAGPVAVLWWSLLASVVLAVGWRWLVTSVTDLGLRVMLPSWLPAYLVCFLGGGVIGHLVIAHRHDLLRSRTFAWLASRSWLALVVAGGALAVGNSPLGGPWTFVQTSTTELTIRFAANTVAALALLFGIAASVRGSVLPRLFAVRWLETVGRWSYGVYLWHMPVVVMAWSQGLIPRDGLAFLVWVAGLVAVSTALGAVTYRFVEQPAIAYSKSVPSRLRG